MAEENEDLNLTQEEIEEIKNNPELAEELDNLGYGSPTKQEKKDIFSFFQKILKSKDTIKTANLSDEELPPVRVLRSCSNYADIMGLDEIRKFLHDEAEVILGSSLSKTGFLINSAITTKKESQFGTKERRSNKGWFKKKETQGE